MNNKIRLQKIALFLDLYETKRYLNSKSEMNYQALTSERKINMLFQLVMQNGLSQ